MRASFHSPIGRVATPIWKRGELAAGQEIRGPAVIEEYSATTVLLPGDVARVGTLGELIIDCTASPECA